MHVLLDEHSLPELDALPMAQLRLLFAVRRANEAPMKEFSERLGIAQSSITKLADGLAKRGLIERASDPNDRRVIRLKTTDLAQRILKEDKSLKIRVFQAIWNRFTEEERSSVVQGLQTFLRVAEEFRRSEDELSASPVERDETEPMEDATESSEPLLDLMNRPVRGKLRSQES
jgi:DNA-binding MarR family transcriptional regulator